MGKGTYVFERKTVLKKPTSNPKPPKKPPTTPSGADPNQQDALQHTPFMMAAWFGKVETAREIFERVSKCLPACLPACLCVCA